MKLEIVKYGHPILRTKGKPVSKVDDRIRTLASDMIDTMHAANGVGLAAQQVGAPLQLTVIDVLHSEERPSRMWIGGQEVNLPDYMPLIALNPELTLGEDEEIGTEGCLSFPEITADISRAGKVKAKVQLLDGRILEFEAEGLLARALQHEVDHLHGILFIDRMSAATKVSLAGRLKRMQKENRES